MGAQQLVSDASRTGADRRYLRMIWTLIDHGDTVVTISRLAQQLGLVPSTVSGRVRRLAERGLLEHERYRSFTLTREGTAEALQAVRVHRLLRVFLHESLGYPWAELSGDADTLEPVVTDRFVAQVDSNLGSPKTDPYGEPIPGRDGTVSAPDDLVMIAAAQFRQRDWVVSRVTDTNGGVMGVVQGHGLYPGTSLSITDWNPTAGVMQAATSAGLVSLGLPTVRALRVVPAA